MYGTGIAHMWAPGWVRREAVSSLLCFSAWQEHLGISKYLKVGWQACWMARFVFSTVLVKVLWSEPAAVIRACHLPNAQCVPGFVPSTHKHHHILIHFGLVCNKLFSKHNYCHLAYKKTEAPRGSFLVCLFVCFLVQSYSFFFSLP